MGAQIPPDVRRAIAELQNLKFAAHRGMENALGAPLPPAAERAFQYWLMRAYDMGRTLEATRRDGG
jgi:hypothetical protein